MHLWSWIALMRITTTLCATTFGMKCNKCRFDAHWIRLAMLHSVVIGGLSGGYYVHTCLSSPKLALVTQKLGFFCIQTSHHAPILVSLKWWPDI